MSTEFEDRADARFRAMDARFGTIDRRFVSVERRIDAIEEALKAQADGGLQRIRSLEGRLDATDARIDLMADKTLLRVDQQRREFLRTLLFAIAATSLGWGVVALGHCVWAR